jgi:hypothetical protein
VTEARENEVKLRLSDGELARLDELRPSGASRAAYVRSILREPTSQAEVASRSEALAILTALARDGRVSAAIALERALREATTADTDDELAEILRS